jgi:hypothetical protein
VGLESPFLVGFQPQIGLELREHMHYVGIESLANFRSLATSMRITMSLSIDEAQVAWFAMIVASTSLSPFR